MRRAFLLLIAAVLSVARPEGSQTVTAVNEQAGLFNCVCPQGIGSGPVHAPAVAMAWQRYAQLNTQLDAAMAEISGCLAEPTSARCTNLRSREGSLRTQLAAAMALTEAAKSQAPALCAARCNAGAASPQQPARQPPSSSGNDATGVPVGRDWSADKTVSAERPIDGLSETQRRWLEDKQRALRAFKPLRSAPGSQAGARQDDARAQLLQRVGAGLSAALPTLLVDALSQTGRAWTKGTGSERDAALQRLKALRLLALAEIGVKDQSAQSPAEREISLYLENEYLFETVLIPAAVALPRKDERT